MIIIVKASRPHSLSSALRRCRPASLPKMMALLMEFPPPTYREQPWDDCAGRVVDAPVDVDPQAGKGVPERGGPDLDAVVVVHGSSSGADAWTTHKTSIVNFLP
jgi:hypothetical protein